MSLKRFEDLEFEPISLVGIDGIQAVLEFESGFGVSVIKSPYSYGGKSGLFELAVLKDGRITYSTKITDDVMGYLSESEVTELMLKVQELC